MNRVNSKKANHYFQLFTSTLIVILSSVSFYSSAQKISQNTAVKFPPEIVQIQPNVSYDFLLAADYYSGNKRSGGVIILHDCRSNRKSYQTLAENIALQGLHTLLVDLRGYGASVSNAYSAEEAKSQAKDIISLQSEMGKLTTKWPDDLLTMHQFLSKKIGKNAGISIIASGCSSPYAVMLAEKIQLKSIVMITPKMSYGDKERYKSLIDMPSYFVTSSNHQDSYETTNELFTWSGDKHTKIQIFKGTSNNYQLLSNNNNLINDIAKWIKYSLR